MPGDCSNSWPPYGCEWNIGYLWRSTYLLERIVLIALALMLARVVLIVIHTSYILARRAGSTDATDARGELVAEICIKLGILRSIFSTAPYLGLMGTCFGILDMFSGGFSGSRPSIVIWIVLGMRVAFLPTAAGILVAVPATCLHNYLRTRLESLKRELSNSPFEKRRFPLNARLSQFPYAVITAPALAVLIAGYMTFPSLRPPKGLPVRLMSIGALETKAPPVEPIVIAVVSTKTSVAPVLYVNSKKTPWDELENKLRSELRVRPPQSIAYVQADKDAYWKYVADVIDIAEGLHAKVVLLTTTPDVSLSHMRQRANPHR